MIEFAILVSEADTSATPLANTKTVVEIIQSLVTTTAVVVGGIWAYFKFVKGRTLRPRLEVTIAGTWVIAEGVQHPHVTVSVKNIGTTVVRLLQEGTGLAIEALETPQPAGKNSMVWAAGRTVRVFADHEWIEPGETISNDLISTASFNDQPVRANVRLVWQWSGGKHNIVVMAHKIIWPDDKPVSEQTGKKEGVSDGNEGLGQG
ncbi:hypothetical protein [Microbacterium sp. NPDC056736]|uniref:hypothetical protein n=1 Tax=Microbacterium sp. NPDC056736 TaxID=3345932 RepID=UPI00366E257F